MNKLNIGYIDITLRMIDLLGKQIDNSINSLKKFGKEATNVTKQFTSSSMEGLVKWDEGVDRFRNSLGQFVKVQKDQAKAGDNLNKTNTRIKWSYLQIAFGAMAAAKAFRDVTSAIKETFFEGIKLSFIQEIIDSLTPFIDVVVEIFWKLVDIFTDMDPKLKTFISLAIILIPVIGNIVTIAAQAILFFGGLAAILGTMGAVVALLSPLIVALGIVIGTSLGDLITSLNLKEPLAKLGQQTKGIFTSISVFLTNLAKNLPEPFRKFIDFVSRGLEILHMFLSGNIKEGMGAATSLLIDLGETIKNIFLGLWDKVKTLAANAFVSIFSMLTKLPIIGDILIFMGNIWTGIVNFLKDDEQKKTIGNLFAKIFSSLGGNEEVTTSIGKFIDDTIGNIKKFFEEVKQIKTVGDAVSFILKAIGFSENLATAVGELVDNIISSFKTWLETGENIKSVEGAFELLIKGITKWGEWGSYIAQKIAEGIRDNMVEKGKDLVAEGLSNLIIAAKKSKLIGGVIGLLGFQTGGIVPGPIGKPVPAIVHGGETILPTNHSAGNVFFSPNIEININGNAEAGDIRRGAAESMNEWKWELQRMRL